MRQTKFVILITLSTLLISCSGGSNDPTPNSPEPTKVYIFSVTATPTAQESITIKNNSGTTQDLSNWKLGDKNAPDAYNIPNGTSLTNGQTKTFSGTTLGFAINDSGETIYLKNSSGSTIDTWSN
jgi:Lamin Tail Domain